MSSGERSPKRQRLESYSPGSPPLSSDTKAAFVPPQTPPPSERMSPSWQSQAQNISTQIPGTVSNLPTPSSTAGFTHHMSGRDAGDSATQTPASEGDVLSKRDGDGDAEMTDRQDFANGDVKMAEADHRRTDHEREGSDETTVASRDAAPKLYKLTVTPIEPCEPNLAEDLIELYGLKAVQARFARYDPVTGAKINKLRKSYEGKVKALELDGKNKARANQNELWGLLHPQWDDPTDQPGKVMWDNKLDNLKSEGKLLGDAKSHDDLFSKLDAALNLAPGRLPPKEHKEWQNMLGLDDLPATTKPGTSILEKRPMGVPAAGASTTPMAQARSSAPSSPHNGLGRPGRSGAKRRYDDSSFEGYTGYDDDTSIKDEQGRRDSNSKRQKRLPSSSQNSPGYADATSPGGSNMVGVRSS